MVLDHKGQNPLPLVSIYVFVEQNHMLKLQSKVTKCEIRFSDTLKVGCLVFKFFCFPVMLMRSKKSVKNSNVFHKHYGNI